MLFFIRVLSPSLLIFKAITTEFVKFEGMYCCAISPGMHSKRMSCLLIQPKMQSCHKYLQLSLFSFVVVFLYDLKDLLVTTVPAASYYTNTCQCQQPKNNQNTRLTTRKQLPFMTKRIDFLADSRDERAVVF